MTPPTPGWALLRDAALSLALRHPFAGEFANPRNMLPYTYADSPLVIQDVEPWQGGAKPGAICPNLPQGAGYLSDQLGAAFTLLTFGRVPVVPPHPWLKVLGFAADGPEARAFGAAEGSAYLIRPDMHVAARWKKATAGGIDLALQKNLGHFVDPDRQTSMERKTSDDPSATTNAQVTLEDFYAALAQAVDQVGSERAPLLLSKLALLMAEHMADPAQAMCLVEQARKDL
jgi:hypothetical protein